MKEEIGRERSRVQQLPHLSANVGECMHHHAAEHRALWHTGWPRNHSAPRGITEKIHGTFPVQYAEFLTATYASSYYVWKGRASPVNSSMINKIAKAKRYAEEPERIQFTRFEATFRGENDVHTTNYNNGEWDCTCRFFHDWGDCSHTMAMQRILGVTIPAAHRHGIPAGLGTGPLAH